MSPPSAYVPRVFGYRISKTGRPPPKGKSSRIESSKSSSNSEKGQVVALKDEVAALKAQLQELKGKGGAREGGAARMVIE